MGCPIRLGNFSEEKSKVRRLVVLLWCLTWDAQAELASSAPDGLEQGFLRPPTSARPWAYWFWLNGNISRDGLTADLEAMQRVGLGGVVLFDAAVEIPEGSVRFGSAEWRVLFQHTIAEAHRLGLEVDLHNAPGWCGSGGPWITPEMGMQMLVSSRTNLTGPIHFRGLLPKLPGPSSSGPDVATLAFPTLVGEGAPVPGFAPKLTASVISGFQGANLLDHNPDTFITLPGPTARAPQFLQMEFSKPFTASLLKLTGVGSVQSIQGVMQVSDDGRRFRDVRQFISSRAALTLEFEPTTARYFRLLFTQSDPQTGSLRFSELELTPVFRIDLARAKSGLGPLPASALRQRPIPEVPSCGTISLANVLDLTAKTDSEGLLEWDVPPGQWTLMRFAGRANGQLNHPARAGGLGLECDKLSKEAIQAHFDAFLAPLLGSLDSVTRRAWTGIHVDSWEIGYQNWTPLLREEFERRRGYDLLPYLPATSGRIVGSRELSERFLWDLRRTIADLVADNYAGYLAELAHRHGLQLSIEGYGSAGSGPFNELTYAGRADIPMAEFWLEDHDLRQLGLKSTPSAAHTGGKPVVAAEAFTSYPAFAKWQNHPFSLKPLGDAAFCEGINRLVFHRYAHQPWLDRRPGITMGPWGVEYEHTETWWEQSRAWHQYLARCQFMLQQGLFVADICYLTEEGAYTKAPSRDQLEPRPPPGYDYDLASPEVVLSRMSVKDCRLWLPGGMTYRVMVLPPTDRMTPALLVKIRELVEAGATVLGPCPSKSPSLTGYPECDAAVSRQARELWGPCDGQAVREHAIGRGKVIWGKPLGEVLAELAGPPDFQQLTVSRGYALRYLHRRIAGVDTYFVANPNSSSSGSEGLVAECSFRVAGRQPEIWHPDTGQIEKPALWREQQVQTTLPLKFGPAGSQFVVFRNSASGLDPIQTATRDGLPEVWLDATISANSHIRLLAAKTGKYEFKTASGKFFQARRQVLPRPITVGGPWEVHFPSKGGAPERVTLEHLASWTKHPEPGVKYFSGTATYYKTFNVPAHFIREDQRLYLDLGRVQVIAEVMLNGLDLGILWKPPFETDISEVVKAGDNALEIRVVNLWPNRLIGDEQLADDCQWRRAEGGGGQPLAEWPSWLVARQPRPTGRFTFTTWKHWTRDSPLLESGLLGPVVVRAVEQVTLN